MELQFRSRGREMSLLTILSISLFCFSVNSFAALAIEPADDFSVSGPEGGPFVPNETVYVLRNNGESTLFWGADENASWLDCNPEWGSLDPNETVDVTVSINAAAESLPAGGYGEDIVFTNTSNGSQYIRTALLTVTTETEAGPVAWWKLDGDATDSSGNGSDGVLLGNPEWVTEGVHDGAISLDPNDGIFDYMEAPFVINPADGSFSAFAWVKGGGDMVGIISQFDNVTGPGRYWLGINGGYLWTSLRTSGAWGLFDDTLWDLDSWHHVGVVWNFQAGTRHLYLDGIYAVGDTTSIGNLEACMGQLLIGANKTLEDEYFWSGLIDDVRIYDRVLSEAEIAELAGIGPLVISPDEPFDAFGEPGGPFTPAYQDNTIKNLGDQVMYWGIDTLPDWVDVDKSFGSLDPNESTTVRVFLTDDADALGEGFYTAAVTINNLSVTQEPLVRDVNLDIQLIRGIWVAPDLFDLTLIEGTQRQDTLTIGNDSSTETYNFSLRTRTVSRSASTSMAVMSEDAMAMAPQKMIFDAEQALNAEYKPGQVLVRFAPQASRTYANKAQREEKLAAAIPDVIILQQYEFVPGLCLVQLPDGVDVPEALESFNAREDILYVQPNYRVYANDLFPNDPRFGDLWGLHNTGQSSGKVDADIDAPEAWSLSAGSDAVIVAVIDTGVDYNHEDLAANMWINEPEYYGSAGIDDDGNGYVDDIYGYDFCNYDPNPIDDHYHGTHCAGTIGAVGGNGKGITGVCWDVKVMALKFLDAGGGGWTDDAIQCVEYATMMGAHVMSNSWGGGGYSQGLKDAIDAAGAAGIAFVAAAGNDSVNNDTYPHYPSSYTSSNLIAVAATDRNDNKSSFSNYGPTSVDLGAPGSSILSCEPGNRYQYLNGTSMATPHVAGACAMLYSLNPMLSAEEVKTILLDTVNPISALAGKCVSGGRLNLNNAVLETSTPWISFDIEEGLVGPGALIDIQVTFDATGLTPGQYFAEITIITDDPAHPQMTVPVSMTVLPDPLEVTPETPFEPNGLEGGPFEPNSIVYMLTNVGNQGLEWAAQWEADWLNVEPAAGLLDPNQTTEVFVSLNGKALLLDPNLYEETLVFHNVVLGSIQPRPVSLKVRPPDKFTEYFENGAFDMGFRAVYLRPDNTISHYAACLESCSIGDFLTDPAGGTYLALGDDDYVEVPFEGGKQFEFYGQHYERIYVGSNGYLTFGQGDMAFIASLDDHFRLARIAPLYTDLTPANDECISYLQTEDRFVVTYQQVPIYGDKNRLSSFQVELFFVDGAIRLSYLDIDAPEMIIGLSDGRQRPHFFNESDFSDYGECCECGDTDGDSSVGFSDLCEFALAWLDGTCSGPGWCGWNDYDRSGQVNLADFTALSENWQHAKYAWSQPEFLVELNGKIWSQPEYLPELDGDGYKARQVCLSSDSLMIYFSRYVPALSYYHLFQGTRSSTDEPFGDIRMLSELPQSGGNLANPWLSADGQRLYYNQFHPATNEGFIKVAKWSEPQQEWVYEKTFNEIHYGSGYKETSPALTDDELTIFFNSTRPDAQGSTIIWTASRSSISDLFTDLRQLTELNAYIEGAATPAVLPDGLTLYFDAMAPEDGNPAIFKVNRLSLSQPFENPEKTEFPGHETKWEICCHITPDKKTLFFQNGSALEHGGIWMTAFEPDADGDPAIMPYVMEDDLTIYFVRTISALGYTCILEASRQNPEEAFTNEQILTELAITGYNVSGPWLSEDGLRIYYHENDGTYADIKMAVRANLNSSWVPTKVFDELTGDVSAASPALSQDELIIVYQSSSSGSIYEDTVNIWMGVRETTGAHFTEIRPLDEINSPYHDGDPHISADGLAIYYEVKDENRDYNLYKATRNSVDEPFGSVERIPPDVGTATSQPCVIQAGKKIYFRDTDGVSNGLWLSKWIKEESPCVPR